MKEVQAKAKLFEEENWMRKCLLKYKNKIEARVPNGDNIYQQDQQVTKRNNYHLEEGPRVVSRHLINFPATSGITLPDTLQNQIIMPRTSVCNIESNDKIGKMIHQLVKEQ